MERNVSFNPVPEYEKKRKLEPVDDYTEDMEKMEKRDFDRQYKRQFEENRINTMNQRKADKKFISDDEWDKLDSDTGPETTYTGEAELEEGPILEGRLNALTNRGYNVKEKINERTGENTKNLGVWGGKTRRVRKAKKTKKSKKVRKVRKTKNTRRKVRKTRKSRK
jgi:hypothetical protein